MESMAGEIAAKLLPLFRRIGNSGFSRDVFAVSFHHLPLALRKKYVYFAVC